MICISPMEPYNYFLLSECFSPHTVSLRSIENKDKNLRRVIFSERRSNGVYSFVCEKIWCAFVSNTRHLQKSEYKYPFAHQESDFIVNKDTPKRYKSSPILFISTPNSGTHSIIYFLTFATGLKFRQFDEFRILQRDELFRKDLQNCIEGRFNIHSHYPIPDYGMKLLSTLKRK